MANNKARGIARELSSQMELLQAELNRKRKASRQARQGGDGAKKKYMRRGDVARYRGAG